MSETPMDWTCAPHLRHGNKRPGHGDLQKISTFAPCIIHAENNIARTD
jgi:hypothetical protein